jgi:ABC-type multidrug transport system fused ATPase/permease subunit
LLALWASVLPSLLTLLLSTLLVSVLSTLLTVTLPLLTLLALPVLLSTTLALALLVVLVALILIVSVHSTGGRPLRLPPGDGFDPNVPRRQRRIVTHHLAPVEAVAGQSVPTNPRILRLRPASPRRV